LASISRHLPLDPFPIMEPARPAFFKCHGRGNRDGEFRKLLDLTRARSRDPYRPRFPPRMK